MLTQPPLFLFVFVFYPLFMQRSSWLCIFSKEIYLAPSLSSFCIYLATCQPKGREGGIVVANVTVKGNWQGGSFNEVFQACALFCHPLFHCWRATHVNGALPQDTVSWLTLSQLTGQKWLEWCSRCWRKEKKTRVCQTCEHFIIETVSLSLSVTADCLRQRPFRAHCTCAHSSNSITSRLSVRSLKMSQWLSVFRVFSSILDKWWLLPAEWL